MSRSLRLIACVAFGTVLAAPALAAQGGIRGRIADSAGAALGRALVTVEGTAFRAITSDQGVYEIRGVPAGSHMVRVRLLGYVAATARVTVASGQDARADFALRSQPIALNPVEVVVGSRAQHTAAEELAVPVDVFPVQEIRAQGTAETSQILSQLAPSVIFPRQTIADGTDIVRPFVQRGLSPDHTLVLINGKRRHATALVHVFGASSGAGASGVDLNAIPVSAIEQMEVLRDGAAAQYGSDAIAGVVNLKLKSGAFSPTLSVDGGRYTPADFPDDGTTIDVAGAWGIAVGRGSVGVFAEYRDREATNRAGADPSDQIVLGDGDVVDTVDNTVVTKRNPVPQPNHHWGDGLSKDILTFVNVAVPLNPDRTVELYGFGGFSFREGTGNGFRRTGLDARNWPQIYPLGFLPTFDADVLDISDVWGLRGVLSGWSFDLSGSFGYNEFEFNLTNTLNTSLGPCLDVPCAPGEDGTLGTLDDPGIPNQTAFSAGELRRREITFSLDVSRRFEVGLASPLNVVLGAAFRRDNYEILPGEPASYIQGWHDDQYGDVAPPGSQVFPGFQPRHAADTSRNNFGVFADLEANLSETFLANVAGRFESYSDFGERLTGKVAVRWQPSRQITVRAAASTGFRAPSLSQSAYASTVTNFAPDPVTGTLEPFEVGIFPVASAAAQALGATPLTEETSVNLSGGVAFSPSDQVTITADYFFTDLDDRVLMTSELRGPEIEAILTAAGESEVTSARYFSNALNTRTEGVDLTVSYGVPVGLSGRVTLSGTYNYTETKVIGAIPNVPGTSVPLFDPLFEGSLLSLTRERPLWRGVVTGRYTDGRWNFLVRSSIYGQYKSALLSYGEAQKYGEEAVFDAEVGRTLAQGVTLALGARNVFDNFPDRAGQANSFGLGQFPTASPFGYNGRYIYARAELRLRP